MTLPDRIGGVFLVTLGLAVVIASLGLPAIPGQPVGPAIFPIVLGVALGVAGLIIFLKPERHADHERKESDAPSVIGTLRLLSPVAMMLLGYFIMEPVGFLLTGFLIVLITSLLLRGTIVASLLLAVVMPTVVYAIFANLLRVPLPAGVLPLPW